MKKSIAHTVTCLCLLSVFQGCQNYSFSINKNELYSPRPIFTAYSISDPHLETCVHQAIKDQEVRSAAALRYLSCSYAGIKQLDGLEVFYQLQSLKLAHNKLDKIDLLLQLSELQVLDLSHNNLRSAQRLLDLPHLQRLNLENNERLDCQLEYRAENLNIREPEHCLGGDNSEHSLRPTGAKTTR